MRQHDTASANPKIIGFVAPTEEVDLLALQAATEMGIAEQVLIRRGNLEEGVAIAREMLADGVEVIVSRGGTADMIIHSDIDIPVVPVNLTCQELSQAVFDAKNVTGLERPRIALLSVENMNQDVELFARVLGADLQIYIIEGTHDSIAAAVESVARDGADVVVGGRHSTHLAGKAGFNTIMLPSSVDSIRIALGDAAKLASAIHLEQARTQRFKTLVNHMREGVLFVDQGGSIRIANTAAAEIFRLDDDRPGTITIADILPFPGIADRSGDTTGTREEVVTVGDATFIATMVPAHVGRDLSGMIVTLQETNRIAQMDAKIRSNLRVKGLVAAYRFDDIKGASAAIRETRRLAAKYAATDSTILIFGETGTGKELFAQSIHNASRNAGGPFVAVNCAALPPSLLESELFGYDEGAFTGANRKGKAGLIELAHGGTLFLDEISEMDHYGQVRLLRFLQERQIMRLGGDRYLPVDVRVIAASNRDLRRAVTEGNFREDLFYRLKVLSLPIPPLRERGNDVEILTEDMLTRWRSVSGRKITLSKPARQALLSHNWPGNIRELANVIENLVVSAEHSLVDVETIRRILYEELSSSPVSGAMNTTPPIGDERTNIERLLRESNGNHTRVAELLGIHRSTLYRKLSRLGIQR